MKTIHNLHPSSTCSTLRTAIAMAASLALLSACSEHSPAPSESGSQSKASAASQKTEDAHKTANAHDAQMDVASHEHKTVKYQKPGANIRLGSPEALSMAANSSEQFNVSFATQNTGTLMVSAKAKEGLSLSDEGAQYTFDLSQEAPSLDLNITSGEDGTYHVMFHATISNDSGESSRVFGIPVYVGKPDANKAQKPANTSGVVIMKAKETIR